MEYPVNLQLKERRCLVIGGGTVAERKTETLVKAGACVTVIAPNTTPQLSRLSEQGTVEWLRRPYRQGDIEGYFITVCATDSTEINAKAAAEAREKGSLVNVVDAPELCDFIVPAHIERGDLLITISTGGKSPALTRRLREELDTLYGAEYGQFLNVVSQARDEVKKRLALSREREAFWRRVIDRGMIELLRQGKLGEAEERLYNAISRIGTEP